MTGENQAMEEIALETDADVGHAEPQVVVASGGSTGLWLASELAPEGWPVPHQSSCFFCPSIQPREVEELPADHLRRMVLMEARAEPRLEKIEGLWRRKRQRDALPGPITEFIREREFWLRKSTGSCAKYQRSWFATSRHMPRVSRCRRSHNSFAFDWGATLMAHKPRSRYQRMQLTSWS